jgi:CubicO group peptidase (beta-lactamase class C family)
MTDRLYTRRNTLCAATAACLVGTVRIDAAGDTDSAGGTAAVSPEKLREQRRRFQGQELITARRYGWIFNLGESPRIVWRDANMVRRLGCIEPLRVRWFDAELRESPAPAHPGRWAAVVETVAPNGTPVRRSLTFLCRPPGFFVYMPGKAKISLADDPPVAPQVWREHLDEAERFAHDLLTSGFNDTEQGVTLLAGLMDSAPLGRPPTSTETAAARNQEFHLAVKIKVLGIKPAPLKPPRRRAAGAAPTLHAGSPGDAGKAADAKQRIEDVCRAWAADSGVPFTTLVARRGVIVTHGAFGNDPSGNPIPLDYRADVASISKSLTAILFSLFLDQGRVRLDDKVSVAFPDYPRDDLHVPTFRQSLTHTSGLSGHSEFDGFFNPHLENVILNGIDVNEPGKAYNYSGMGYDLVAKAMELLGGKTLARLFADHLMKPLALGDMSVGASAGTRPTVYQLATFAQWLANRGSYGDLEFITPAIFQSLLPEDLSRRYPATNQVEGIGMHWTPHPRQGHLDATGAPATFFSAQTVGHGALSGCIYLADLEHGLIVAQVRQATGPRYGEWVPRFFEAIRTSFRDD